MSNPILPGWEHIPDGEPRVFQDRIYLYGSHDNEASGTFCDYKLKVWSASIHNLNEWTCHGVSFQTREDRDHSSSVDYTDHPLYAPDVVYKDGKYYLYAYILGAKGCVGVSDTPEGPFQLLSTYQYHESDAGDEGIYNDAGVLVDDDGKVYIYYGFERSYMNQIDPKTMHTILPGSLKYDVIPRGKEENDFFEASSPRKINGKYYLIYSPRRGSRLAYATSDKPTGPFVYRGYIIDNGVEYPAGNNHGSICCINGQWYVFYHRMTNGSLFSRKACVEKIKIQPDGSIPTVEMTSLGFEESLNPYKVTQAEVACVLMGGCNISWMDKFEHPIVGIKTGAVIGYKYFDFGVDYSSTTMGFTIKIVGTGCKSKIHIRIDGKEGREIGTCFIDTYTGSYTTTVQNVTGRHSIFFVVEHIYDGWYKEAFDDRDLFIMEKFVFTK